MERERVEKRARTGGTWGAYDSGRPAGPVSAAASGYTSGARPSYGVLSTIVVLVDTFAAARIC